MGVPTLPAVLSPVVSISNQDVSLESPELTMNVAHPNLLAKPLPQFSSELFSVHAWFPVRSDTTTKNPRGNSISNQSSGSTRETNSWEKSSFSRGFQTILQHGQGAQ